MASRPGESFMDKTAIVTGGSAGIGRAVARAFAAAGANVVIAARNREAAGRSAEAIQRETGGRVIAAPTDVGVPAECVRLIDDAVAAFGSVDVLVNNAALFRLIPLADVAPEDAARFLGVNFNGPLFCSQALARWAIANKRMAAIVNISSISAARPAPGCGLYSASKAALDSMTKSMALEWAGKGIRVNGVAPGHVLTEGVEADFAAGRLDRAAMMQRIPAGRVADVADVAEAVLFLASERARHIVGATLTIDGGEGM
jgi:NAD(P)-dependent dehydrogenase (short-subunit alcohol dehydrogenase family)